MLDRLTANLEPEVQTSLTAAAERGDASNSLVNYRAIESMIARKAAAVIQPELPLSTPSPDVAPAFVARALKRGCGGAHGLKDAEDIADTMQKRLEGVRPATASDSASAAEGWRHIRARGDGTELSVQWEKLGDGNEH